jgi:hypothetical protein
VVSVSGVKAAVVPVRIGTTLFGALDTAQRLVVPSLKVGSCQHTQQQDTISFPRRVVEGV